MKNPLKQNLTVIAFYTKRLFQWLIMFGFSFGILEEISSYSFKTGKAFFYLTVIVLTAWWHKNTKK